MNINSNFKGGTKIGGRSYIARVFEGFVCFRLIFYDIEIVVRAYVKLANEVGILLKYQQK